MECFISWDRTQADIHRVSDYRDIRLTFNGTSACNNGLYIITTPPRGRSLDVLPFVEDIFGRTGRRYGTHIPLIWYFRLDGGPWMRMRDNGTTKYFRVGRCDHSFSIGVCVDMAYHQEDGYYHLGGPGASICRAIPL